MNKSFNTLVGIALAVLSCGLLIYSFETDRSLVQIILSFVILYFPIAFFSSIKGKVPVFLFSSFLILLGYICYKNQWFDTGFGAVLALLLGSATFFFRVSKAKTFSSENYKKNQTEKRVDPDLGK